MVFPPVDPGQDINNAHFLWDLTINFQQSISYAVPASRGFLSIGSGSAICVQAVRLSIDYFCQSRNSLKGPLPIREVQS